MTQASARFLQDQSGATAIEYGVVALFVAIVLIAVAQTIGLHLSMTFVRAVGFITKGHAHTS
jgi:pilus assembly protein Flp/PilA